MFAGHRPTFYHCAAQPIYNIASTEITEETTSYKYVHQVY